MARTTGIAGATAFHRFRGTNRIQASATYIRSEAAARPAVQNWVLRLQLPVEAQDVFEVIGPGLAEDSHGRRLAFRLQIMIFGVSVLATGSARSEHPVCDNR